MNVHKSQLAGISPAEARRKIRLGEWVWPTSGLSLGFAQANLVILPESAAFDFLLFCQRNKKACPVIDVTAPGDPVPRLIAPESDIRTDLPLYRIYRNGALEREVRDILEYWRHDLVAFLIGCSFSFEEALIRSGVPIRHIELGRNVPMYVTNRQCMPAGVFRGPLVVSMRPIPSHLVSKAITITSRYPSVHGAPVHIGNPWALGISDVSRPDFGDPVPIYEGEVPVFWACGVTPQAVAMSSRPQFMITHAPGHMFITDVRNEELEEVVGGR